MTKQCETCKQKAAALCTGSRTGVDCYCSRDARARRMADATITKNLADAKKTSALYTAAEQYLSAETYATQAPAIQALIKATNVIKGLEI